MLTQKQGNKITMLPLRMDAAIEALDIGVLHRFAGSDVMPVDPVRR